MCPIGMLNVIGVGLLVVVGSSDDRSAPPTPYVGILVDYDHTCFLFLFATIVQGGNSLTWYVARGGQEKKSSL